MVQMGFENQVKLNKVDILIWVVVSNIFYFHPYLGKWSNLANIFQWRHTMDSSALGRRSGVEGCASPLWVNNLANIFQMGWNHQLVICSACLGQVQPPEVQHKTPPESHDGVGRRLLSFWSLGKWQLGSGSVYSRKIWKEKWLPMALNGR